MLQFIITSITRRYRVRTVIIFTKVWKWWFIFKRSPKTIYKKIVQFLQGNIKVKRLLCKNFLIFTYPVSIQKESVLHLRNLTNKLGRRGTQVTPRVYWRNGKESGDKSNPLVSSFWTSFVLLDFWVRGFIVCFYDKSKVTPLKSVSQYVLTFPSVFNITCW